MNRKIIEKILDALNKPQVDVSYVRGILETLLETLPEEKTQEVKLFQGKKVDEFIPPLGARTNMSEAEILEQQAKARLNNITNVAI